ncbi:phosphatase PAP2 family protein [Rhodoflexus caldus]|uniref:phosphatase PAP2 family protein n=1 Tax=Rhodoflexus caldus TaxID=2891236 RepID=UPI002029D791|nr:phosphatase PAP2 family protein [Rhodoflexus caldus]
MFQTEINHFLQSWESEWLTLLMRYISQMGYQPFYIAVLLTVIFGVDTRKGLWVLQVLMWVGIITTFLKELVALPRPLDVDNTLKFMGTNYNQTNTLFSMRGAESFWAMLPSDVIAYYRENRLTSFGFPSGHVSGAVAFFGGLALAFPLSAVRVISLIICLLMPISRLYLGVHFLADVLGGLLIGSVGLAVLQVWMRNTATKQRPHKRVHVSSLIWWFILPIVLLFMPHMNRELLIILLACNTFYLAFTLLGNPMPNGGILRRSFSVAIALASFIGFSILSNNILRLLNVMDENIQQLVIRFVEFAIALILALYINFRIRLMRPEIKTTT